MSNTNSPHKKWQLFSLFIAIFAIIELVAVLVLPAYHALAWFFFYTAISNFCIPWLPHEPAVLLCGTLFSPWLVAICGGIATCFMELFNYQILQRIMKLKPLEVLKEKQVYQKFESYFKKAPFFSLVFAGFTPIPFAPFRIFAVTSNYSLSLYILSVFVGRTPRYYILAFSGKMINLPLWSYGIIFAIFIGIFIVTHIHSKKKN
jgi:membrane protein YqaA with SNARE-associated domain